MRRLIVASIVSLFLFFLSNLSSQSYAASTTLGFSPSTGSIGKPYTITLIIDGHGDKFNAAQTTITPSKNLSISDLTLGDCNFSFLKTPSIQNPSFAGVIISSYATKCTAYTLTLIPLAKGQGSLLLTGSSVKRYGDAANILASVQNGTYTLTAALKPQINQGINSPTDGSYEILLHINSSQNTPLMNASILLKSASGKLLQQANTRTSGSVQFSGLHAGIYNVVTEKNNTKLGENVINVSGQNHVLILGLNTQDEAKNPLLHSTSTENGITPLQIGILVICGIVIGIVLAFTIVRFKRKT